MVTLQRTRNGKKLFNPVPLSVARSETSHQPVTGNLRSEQNLVRVWALKLVTNSEEVPYRQTETTTPPYTQQR